ncbi:MAG: glycosyltransferase family 2 protein [Deltaproteobacteria bacterium]|nr:glycosyltransferase family 2 protein [Deltaproteobacteria bacterium]MBW2417763.1 glycosyltransferase family 2 protein [Deltaproteobacteria bacterium]
MTLERRSEDPLISLVVPVLNEEGCIEEFVRRSRAAAAQAELRYEIIFVDDGSSDATPERVAAEAKLDPAVKSVRFTRSFGHQAALSAGLRYASGDAVVTLDGDLQHPPECLPDLVAAWRRGADVVYTLRRESEGQRGSWKARTSALFYGALSRLTALPAAAAGADFRLMDRRAVERFNELGEHFIFVRGLVPWLGFRADRVEYQAQERFAGVPKFVPVRMLRLALDGIFSFSVVPLRLISLLGLATTLFGVVFGIFSLVSYFLGRAEEAGWTSVVVLILVFGGVQLMSLGIVSEYIGRIYEEVKGRPRYVVDSVIGLDSK